jgi:SAM-dependent methyltransferase
MTRGVETRTAVKLVCPACKGDLQEKDAGLECAVCRSAWPLVNGVPYFINTDEYWGEPGISREVARQLTQDAMKRNWRDAVRDHVNARAHYHFISNLERANWYKLLNLAPESIVLDLGAGMGTIAQALAQHYARVYAVERVEERVQFMGVRFQQEPCKNVTVIRTDIDFLPFPDGAFDLIVLNGVLEWLPFSRKQDNPRISQLYYLRLLRKLLRPQGILYVGIENRFNYDFLIGAPDPHINIPAVTVLPRWIADMVCRSRTGDRYRPYLYSHWGYRKLMAEAGFRSSEVFSALPSYTDPKKVRHLHRPSVEFTDDVWVTKNALSRMVKNILLTFDLLKYFGYAYIVFAKN